MQWKSATPLTKHLLLHPLATTNLLITGSIYLSLLCAKHSYKALDMYDSFHPHKYHTDKYT